MDHSTVSLRKIKVKGGAGNPVAAVSRTFALFEKNSQSSASNLEWLKTYLRGTKMRRKRREAIIDFDFSPRTLKDYATAPLLALFE